MKIKATSERNLKYWLKHLTDRETNDRAEMIEQRGFCFWENDLALMLKDIQLMAYGSRSENPIYVAKFSPATNEKLTPPQWERTLEIFQQQRGIPEDQRRIIFEHETFGRIHRYVVWERLNLETMQMLPNPHDAVVCSIAARKITRELREIRNAATGEAHQN